MKQSDYRHEWVERWLNIYITVRNYIGAGRGQIEFLINAFKMGGYVILFLMFFGIEATDVPKWAMIAFSFIYLITMFIMGWAWDKFKGYEVEAQWGNIRDPMQRDIHKIVKEKLK